MSWIGVDRNEEDAGTMFAEPDDSLIVALIHPVSTNSIHESFIGNNSLELRGEVSVCFEVHHSEDSLRQKYQNRTHEAVCDGRAIMIRQLFSHLEYKWTENRERSDYHPCI